MKMPAPEQTSNSARHEPLARIIRELAALTSELQSLLPAIATPPASQREEYLSIGALIDRIPYSEQTIRNLICQGELREGIHYLQRVKHGRVVFVWSEMQQWMRERSSEN